jgi:hypothetical protein
MMKWIDILSITSEETKDRIAADLQRVCKVHPAYTDTSCSDCGKRERLYHKALGEYARERASEAD